MFGSLNIIINAACCLFDHHHITTDIASKLLDRFDPGVDGGDDLFRHCNIVVNVGDYLLRSFRVVVDISDYFLHHRYVTINIMYRPQDSRRRHQSLFFGERVQP